MFEYGSGTPSEQQAFVYENGQIVLEFTGGSGSEALAHRYLWGPAVDQLLADERVHDLFDADENDVLWALTDHLGTVRDWVDSTGVVRDHAEYDAFGRRLDADTVDAAFGWTGRWRDPLTDLQYNDNRWYSPDLQRWMSEDPIGFAGRDANLGRYVGNSPSKLIDPTGLARELHTFRGSKDGQPGTYYQWEEYDRVFIFWKGNGRFGPLQFDPDIVPGVQNVGTGSIDRCGDFATIANRAGQAGEAAKTTVVIAAVGIPGPEDVIIAAGSRLGYQVINQGGRWIIKAGRKILGGADEAVAANKIADLMKIERHHNLPQAQRFQMQFQNAGLCIEDYVEDLTKMQHRLKPGGLHTGDNNWNKLWGQFFRKFDGKPGPTKNQILDELDRIRGIHGLPPWPGK